MDTTTLTIECAGQRVSHGRSPPRINLQCQAVVQSACLSSPPILTASSFETPDRNNVSLYCSPHLATCHDLLAGYIAGCMLFLFCLDSTSFSLLLFHSLLYTFCLLFFLIFFFVFCSSFIPYKQSFFFKLVQPF